MLMLLFVLVLLQGKTAPIFVCNCLTCSVLQRLELPPYSKYCIPAVIIRETESAEIRTFLEKTSELFALRVQQAGGDVPLERFMQPYNSLDDSYQIGTPREIARLFCRIERTAETFACLSGNPDLVAEMNAHLQSDSFGSLDPVVKLKAHESTESKSLFRNMLAAFQESQGSRPLLFPSSQPQAVQLLPSVTAPNIGPPSCTCPTLRRSLEDAGNFGNLKPGASRCFSILESIVRNFSQRVSIILDLNDYCTLLTDSVETLCGLLGVSHTVTSTFARLKV
jgi:hypothetical protein